MASFLALVLACRGGFRGSFFQFPALTLGLNGFRGSLFPVELRMNAELEWEPSIDSILGNDRRIDAAMQPEDAVRPTIN